MSPFKISIAYLFVCTIFIYFSDQVLFTYALQSENLLEYETIKDVLFVLSSCLLIYFLVLRGFREIKNVNQRLVEANDYYKLIFENSPLPIYIIDESNFHFLRVNDAATHKSGRKREEYRHRSIDEFIIGLNKDDLRRISFELDEKSYLELYFESLDKSENIIKQQAFCQRIVYQNRKAIICATIDVARIKDPEIQAMDELLEMLEADRMEIASEIHDGIKQYFGLANGLLKSFKGKHPEISDWRRIDSVIDLTEKGIEESRRLSRALSPMTIEQKGLELSFLLEQLVENLNFLHDVHFEFFYTVNTSFNHETVLNLYRIAQEATRNVIRHAQAKMCAITLEENDECLMFSISDDGVGFDANCNTNSLASLGLKTMRTRALKIGGFFSLKSDKGLGTQIFIKIPLIPDDEKMSA